MTGLDPATLCQIEIPVSDMPRALAFYEAVFGWRAAPAELHEYVVLEVPDDCPFGLALVPRRSAGSSGEATLYFATNVPEEICKRAVAHGGTKRLGPMTLPGYGTIFQIEDPEGCRWGLFQRGAAASTFEDAATD